MNRKLADALAPELAPKGYTMEELRYRLALATVKKELCKEQLSAYYQAVIEASPLRALKDGTAKGDGKGLLSKVMKGLSYTDYVIVGISAYKAMKRIASLFRSRKKR